MQQKNDPKRFKNLQPGFCGNLIDIRVIGNRLKIHKLGGTGGYRRDKFCKFQCVDCARKFPNITLNISGKI